MGATQLVLDAVDILMRRFKDSHARDELTALHGGWTVR
jgi:hypothetical protein